MTVSAEHIFARRYAYHWIVELPASFVVWASSPEPDFIKGRLLWVHWDVDELKELLTQKQDEEFFLTLEVNTMPNLPF
jgi:hypothetical protein